MTKKTIIPAGYRLTVTSWENDGDNYKTESKEGLTREQTKFFVALSVLFYSKNRNAGSFGNMYDPEEEEVEAFTKACQNVFANYNVVEMFPDWELDQNEINNDPDAVVEITTDMLYDLGLVGGDFYTRVLDKLKIEYIPEPIEIEDVTDQFIKP